MQFDDFDTQIQCEEIYDYYLDYVEFCGKIECEKDENE